MLAKVLSRCKKDGVSSVNRAWFELVTGTETEICWSLLNGCCSGLERVFTFSVLIVNGTVVDKVAQLKAHGHV